MARRAGAGAGVLAAVLAAGLAAAAGAVRGAAQSDEYAARGHQPRLVVPVTVNVALGGFSGDGAYGFSQTMTVGGAYPYETNVLDLERVLSETLNVHKPVCVATERALMTQYWMDYAVHNIAHTDLRALEEVLGRSMRYMGREESQLGHGEVHAFEIDVVDVEAFFDVVYSNAVLEDDDAGEARRFKTLGRPREAYTAVILNLDKRNIWEAFEQKMRAEAPQSGQTEPKLPFDGAKMSYSELDRLFVYRYRYGGAAVVGEATTQSWISAGRYVVLDYSAGPVLVGATGGQINTVTHRTFPRLADYAHLTDKIAEARKDPNSHAAMEVNEAAMDLRSHMATNIVSAVRQVFLPDIEFETIRYAEKVVVPIIVLRNHASFNPLVPDHLYSLDLASIKKSVQRMLLPGQEIVFVTGDHSLHDHPVLYMALQKAIRHDTTYERDSAGRLKVKQVPYIDSKVLIHTLESSADYLAAGLLDPTFQNPEWEDDITIPAGTTAPPKRQSLWRGLHTVPVYVLSLMDMEDGLLIDKTSAMAASQDAVLILQTTSGDVVTPYFSGETRVGVHTRDPSKDIVAGLAVAFGGLLPPHKRYSSLHKGIVQDFTWAQGHHPFGPFGNSAGLSKIQQETIIRNSILSRLDVARTLVTSAMDELDRFADNYVKAPFGEYLVHQDTAMWYDGIFFKAEESQSSLELPVPRKVVERLRGELYDLEVNFFARAADLLYEFKLEEAYQFSDSILVKSKAFKTYVERELDDAASSMLCCAVNHIYDEPDDLPLILILGAGGLAVVFGGVYLLSAPRARAAPKGRRQ